MSNNNWNEMWDSAGHRHTLGVDLPVWMLLAMAGLVAIAAMIAAHTYFKQRGQAERSTGMASHWLGLFWLVPVAAALLLVAGYFGVNRSAQSPGHGDDAELGHPTEMITAEIDAAIDADKLSAERPAWVDAGEADDGERKLVVVQGRQFSEIAEAQQDALQATAKLIREDFEQTQNAQGDWQLDKALVQSHAVKKTYVEPIQRRTELNEFSVYRVYHQVELSPQVREAVYPVWRSQVVESRTWILGSLLGFVALLLGTTATYLRIDTMTGGNYRGRLRFASLSLIAAGGLGLSLLLPIA